MADVKKYAIIVAAGSGTRLGSLVPKQFLDLNNFPVVWWSMNAFYKEDKQVKIILVLPENYIDYWKKLHSSLPEENRIPHVITKGGATRSESVVNGLKIIEGNNEGALVAIHDGARPLITETMISNGWKCAKENKTAVPVVPVTDSLRRLCHDTSYSVDRNDFVAVQTPQIFSFPLVKNIYSNLEDGNFTDDASLAESKGYKITLYKGEDNNIKVTRKKDILIASELLRERND